MGTLQAMESFLDRYETPVRDVLEAILNISVEQIVANHRSEAEAGTEDKKAVGIIVQVNNPLLVRDIALPASDRWFYSLNQEYNFQGFNLIRDRLEDILRRTHESLDLRKDSSLENLGIVYRPIGGSGSDGAFHFVKIKGIWQMSNQKYMSPSLSHYVNSWLHYDDTDFFGSFDTINFGDDSYGGASRDLFFETLIAAMFSREECYAIRLSQSIYDDTIPVGKIKIVRARLRDGVFDRLFHNGTYEEVMRMSRPRMDDYMIMKWGMLRQDHKLFPSGEAPTVFDFSYTEITFARDNGSITMHVHEVPLHGVDNKLRYTIK